MLSRKGSLARHAVAVLTPLWIPAVGLSLLTGVPAMLGQPQSAPTMDLSKAMTVSYGTPVAQLVGLAANAWVLLPTMLPALLLALPVYAILAWQAWTHPLVSILAGSEIGYVTPLLGVLTEGPTVDATAPALGDEPTGAALGAAAGAAAWIAGLSPPTFNRRRAAVWLAAVVSIPPAVYVLVTRLFAWRSELSEPSARVGISLAMAATTLWLATDLSDPRMRWALWPATLLWTGTSAWLLSWLERRGAI